MTQKKIKQCFWLNFSISFSILNQNSTFPNACGEALLAKREFMARAEGECRNEFRYLSLYAQVRDKIFHNEWQETTTKSSKELGKNIFKVCKLDLTLKKILYLHPTKHELLN